MKQSRRNAKLTPKKLRKILFVLLLAAVFVAVIVLYLRKQVQTQLAQGKQAEVNTVQVDRGSISTWVYGSGYLSDEDVHRLELPKGVELEEIKVKRGEAVEEGQLLATVNISSVMTAMANLDEEIKEIDEQISQLKTDSNISLISSSVSGRVKEILVSKGQDVASVMREKGALMILSLDGYMAVELENSQLIAGERLTVVTEDGFSFPATVEKNTNGVATILLTDENAVNGAFVTVFNTEGSPVGEGQLSIHSPLKVVGTVGTVEYIYTRLNAQVLSGSSLLSITGTGAAASYENLLRQRSELEDDYAALAGIYQQGGIHAPVSGTIREIQASEVNPRSKVTAQASEASTTTTRITSTTGNSTTTTTSTSTTTTTDTTEYFSISPDETMLMSVTVDESQILSIGEGQKATITVDAIEKKSFEGTVTSIDRAGSSANGVTTYTAEISVAKETGMLSGMSASATIAIESAEDVLLLPIEALNQTGNGYFVYTSHDETTGTLGGMVEVIVGMTNSSYAEIRSGLDQGELVYYEPKAQSGFSMPGNDPGGNFGGNFGGNPMGMGGAPGGMGNPPGGNFGGMPGMR